MHRAVFTVQKVTEVYGASGHWMHSGCMLLQLEFNQHSNAYTKVVYSRDGSTCI